MHDPTRAREAPKQRVCCAAQWTPATLATLLTLALAGCGPAPLLSAPPRFDTQVPADEPRAELRLDVELASIASCEEAFDLALYADRAVELVAWEPPRSTCGRRTLTIRYLSRRTTQDRVLAAAKKAAVSAALAPVASTPPNAAPSAR
jgi:hypothetical protein